MTHCCGTTISQNHSGIFYHTSNYVVKIESCSTQRNFTYRWGLARICRIRRNTHWIQTSSRLLENIENFLSPTNITGVRSWFGLINQISYAFSQVSIPWTFREKSPFLLRSLYSRNFPRIETGDHQINRGRCYNVWCWPTNMIHNRLEQNWHWFQVVTKTLYLSRNQQSVLWDRSLENNLSRIIHKVFWNAPIEGEALELLFGLTSCRMFVLGCSNLIVTVDHKPLNIWPRTLQNSQPESIEDPRAFTSIPIHNNCHFRGK